MRFMIAAGVVGLVAALSVPSYLVQTHIEHKTAVIEGKERLMNISSDSDGKNTTKYENFVYAGGESYIVKDSLWNWHFRARTVYAQIEEGAECELTLSGYRWGFLSMHQNIIAAECDA